MNIALKNSFAVLGTTASQPLGAFAENHIKKLDNLLIIAGQPDDLKGVQVLGMQVLGLVFMPVFWGIVLQQFSWTSFLFEGPKQVLSYLGLMVIGFYFPIMSIREKAKKRQKSISLQLPDSLDLLTISVEAGLDFMSAMRRVVEKHRPGPLKEELERFFKQTELGRPRREALRDMAKRVQIPDLNAVTSALIQGDRLGVSITPILRAQSDMLRTRRGQKAEKAAHEAAVKMLAPLMMCILPSVFIMILGPVIIQMVTDLTR
jgi:tight adherence protein C